MIGASIKDALAVHQDGDLVLAERLYRDVLVSEPNNADALALLAVLLESKGQGVEALSLIDRAVALDPNAPLFRFYQGNVRMALCDYSGAVQAYKQAIEADARPEFFYNLGNANRLLEVWNEAQDAYIETLRLAPAHALARNNLALVYQHKGDLSEAVKELQRAVADAPTYGEGWLNLCNLAEKDGQYDISHDAGLRSIALMPNNHHAWLGLGVALNKVEKHDDAIVAYQEALRLKPDWVEAYDNLAQTYQFMNRVDDAEKAFHQAIAAAGQTIKDEDTRRVDEKEYGNRHWHLALLELLKGDYKRGFARYRARFEDVGGLQRLNVPQPVWQGEDIAGKTILVMDEQGMGDCLMMARYLPLIKQRGARVKFLVHPALVPLFQGWSGMDELFKRGDDPGAFDVYASIFDLPYAFGTTVDTVPNDVPYLPVLSPNDATRLPDDGMINIGIAWAGAPLHKQDGKRTVPLSALVPLFDKINARFYSFNRDKRDGDDDLIVRHRLVDLAPHIANFADTSRYMAQMDLIITCDTSTAHIAGGMGKETWTLLPFDPDWRWLLGRDDTPWYPTMRLFRQERRGHWHGVVENLKEALTNR